MAAAFQQAMNVLQNALECTFVSLHSMTSLHTSSPTKGTEVEREGCLLSIEKGCFCHGASKHMSGAEICLCVRVCPCL